MSICQAQIKILGCERLTSTQEGLNGPGVPHVGCRLKFYYFVGKNFRSLSVAGKSQLIFLSLVGNFSLVLSVVSNVF